MMEYESVWDLERRLAIAKKREADMASMVCLRCDGAGWLNDTTYNRTGETFVCATCYGTGWPIGRVRQAIDQAFSKNIRPKPVENADQEGQADG